MTLVTNDQETFFSHAFFSLRVSLATDEARYTAVRHSGPYSMIYYTRKASGNQVGENRLKFLLAVMNHVKPTRVSLVFEGDPGPIALTSLWAEAIIALPAVPVEMSFGSFSHMRLEMARWDAFVATYYWRAPEAYWLPCCWLCFPRGLSAPGFYTLLYPMFPWQFFWPLCWAASHWQRCP